MLTCSLFSENYYIISSLGFKWLQENSRWKWKNYWIKIISGIIFTQISSWMGSGSWEKSSHHESKLNRRRRRWCPSWRQLNPNYFLWLFCKTSKWKIFQILLSSHLLSLTKSLRTPKEDPFCQWISFLHPSENLPVQKCHLKYRLESQSTQSSYSVQPCWICQFECFPHQSSSPNDSYVKEMLWQELRFRWFFLQRKWWLSPGPGILTQRESQRRQRRWQKELNGDQCWNKSQMLEAIFSVLCFSSWSWVVPLLRLLPSQEVIWLIAALTSKQHQPALHTFNNKEVQIYGDFILCRLLNYIAYINFPSE